MLCFRRRTRSTWKIVVGVLIILACVGTHTNPRAFASEAEAIGGALGQLLLFLLGAWLVYSGIRGKEIKVRFAVDVDKSGILAESSPTSDTASCKISKTCPACGLVSHPSANTCDCGHLFGST
jgi:hypothetical protein